MNTIWRSALLLLVLCSVATMAERGTAAQGEAAPSSFDLVDFSTGPDAPRLGSSLELLLSDLRGREGGAGRLGATAPVTRVLCIPLPSSADASLLIDAVEPTPPLAERLPYYATAPPLLQPASIPGTKRRALRCGDSA